MALRKKITNAFPANSSTGPRIAAVEGKSCGLDKNIMNTSLVQRLVIKALQFLKNSEGGRDGYHRPVRKH